MPKLVSFAGFLINCEVVLCICTMMNVIQRCYIGCQSAIRLLLQSAMYTLAKLLQCFAAKTARAAMSGAYHTMMRFNVDLQVMWIWLCKTGQGNFHT